MGKFSLSKLVYVLLVFCAAAVSSPAQTFTTLAIFDGTNGANAQSSLIQGADGNFYGTTYYGGTNGGASGNCPSFVSGCGTVFKITPGGTLTTLYSFCSQPKCADGEEPAAALVQGTDGNFYGTTSAGANSSCVDGCGTVFKITPGGALTTLHSFDITIEGAEPITALVQGTDGNFYGTTSTRSGASPDFGTVFKMTPGGTLTTLHTFGGTDGNEANALVQGPDGNFYGTTGSGGDFLLCSTGCGTIFKITPSGTLTTLYTFGGTGADGVAPIARLVQAADGNFYGTTTGGGAFALGTVFKITPGGTLTTLHSFNGTDGSRVQGAMIQATDGNFYGTTSAGANGSCLDGCGTVFKITPAGALTTLHNFDGTDGFDPLAGLVQGTNGDFYGTTSQGGATNCNIQTGCGTVFSLSVGLGTSGDFDGDGKADIGVFRPSNGTWFVIPSSNPGTATIQQWGTSGDIPVRGDYDGDGKTDVAVWRPSSGEWFIIPTSNPGSPMLQQWGANGDIPVPGDYDGDGKTDIAVWRPSTGTWFIIPSSNPAAPIIRQWGTSGDIPVPGDYDGDGKTDIAVWRPSTGEWYIIPSSNPGSPILQQWGANGDIPVPGDYDGDSKTDIAVWRPSTGLWFIIPSSNSGSPIIQQWGTGGDIPVPVDYDGDHKTDIAVWRPSSGYWFIIPSSTPTTFTITQWGASSDIPLQKPVGQ